MMLSRLRFVVINAPSTTVLTRPSSSVAAVRRLMPQRRYLSSNDSTNDNNGGATFQTLKQEDNDEDDDMTNWVPPPLKPLTEWEAPDALPPKQAVLGEDDEDDGEVVDWLKTRRASQRKSRDMGVEISVKIHTLLSLKEIQSCLVGMGAKDIKVFRQDEQQDRILVTANSRQHLALLAEILVRHLKARKLGKFNIGGAITGAEGMALDDWKAIDCGNYAVHIMLEQARIDLDFEKLWSGQDDIYQLNDNMANTRIDPEEAEEDYVYNNPVPDTYTGGVTLKQNQDKDISDTISQLERFSFNRKKIIEKPTRPKRKNLRKRNQRHNPSLMRGGGR